MVQRERALRQESPDVRGTGSNGQAALEALGP